MLVALQSCLATLWLILVPGPGLAVGRSQGVDVPPAAAGEASAPDPSRDTRPTLWVIGDSTVRNGAGDGVGWGECLAEHFDGERLRVEVRAIGGRSSRTFRTEGRWQGVLEEAKPGDYVIMQFGHNDSNAPDDPNRPRGSLRGTGEETREIIHPKTGEPETVHTYGWYLRQNIREAREHDLVPIVCSPVPRAPRRGETMSTEARGYAVWGREVAEGEDASFLPLYELIAAHYAAQEQERPHIVKERYFVAAENDYTHTCEAGAKLNAEYVVEGIRGLRSEAGELAKYLLASVEEGSGSGAGLGGEETQSVDNDRR